MCRRILGNASDAEDAVQATFLVLATKAKSLRSRGTLGDWLHEVARRTALNARRVALRRRKMEMSRQHSSTVSERDLDDILPILDEELARLPENYRLPIVLCDLEGQSRKSAAKQLRWPEGSVAGRLARGRQLLAERLTRRGVSLPAGALTLALTSGAAAGGSMATNIASLASQLMASDSFAGAQGASANVLALTQGVLKTMLLSKLKTIATLAILSLGLACGAGWIMHGVAEAQLKPESNGPSKPPAGSSTRKNSPSKAITDTERLRGVWKLRKTTWAGRGNGESSFDDLPWTLTLAFDNEKVGYQTNSRLFEGTIKLDPAKRFIDFSFGGGKEIQGLYSLTDDTLTITSSGNLVVADAKRDRLRPDVANADERKYASTWTRIKETTESVPMDPVANRVAAEKRGRLLCGANLERLAIAIERFRDEHGSYPSAATSDQAGKPLLSWRVAILPYLGEKGLYDEFRQDEPWDGDHNRMLLAKMPKVFASTGKAPMAANSTFFQVVVGEGCLFETGKTIQAARDVSDGTCNTLAVITAPNAVPWTKPADLSYQPSRPLPSLLGGMFDDGLVSFATACGSVHLAPNTISEDLRKLILRNDGERVDFEALMRGNSK